MKQAFQPGFYWNPETGQEVEIRSGVVRPDGHADVVRCPAIFRDITVVEEPQAPAPVKTAPARAARPSRSAAARAQGT